MDWVCKPRHIFFCGLRTQHTKTGRSRCCILSFDDLCIQCQFFDFIEDHPSRSAALNDFKMFIRCSELGKIWQVELLLINLPSDEEIKLLLKAKEENTIDELHVAWRYLYLRHKQGWWHLTTWWHWVWFLSCSEVGKLVLVCTMFLQVFKSCFKLTMLKVLVPRTKRKRMRTQRHFLLRFGTKQKTSYWPLLVSLCSSGIGWTWFIYVYLMIRNNFIVLYWLPTGSNWASPVWQVPQFELRLRAWHFQNTFEERWET